MRKFLVVFLLPLMASADLPPVNLHIFDITKTYHPHYRTAYEVRVNQETCEFYTLDPLRLYWRNAKKGDRVEELNDEEHDKLDPEWVIKTAHQIAFHVKSMLSYGLDYPITVDVVRTGDKCEVVASGQRHKKVSKVHVVISWFKARQLVVSGTGLNGRDHALTFNIK